MRKLFEVSLRRTCQQLCADVCRAIVRFVFNINYFEEIVCLYLLAISVRMLGINWGWGH